MIDAWIVANKIFSTCLAGLFAMFLCIWPTVWDMIDDETNKALSQLVEAVLRRMIRWWEVP